MIAKLFHLDEKDVECIQKIKQEFGFKSEAEVIRYLIRQHSETAKKENGYLLATLREIEERVDLLLDIANTDLVKRRDEICYPISMVESPVISKAKALRKKELANRKQKKDYRRNKN